MPRPRRQGWCGAKIGVRIAEIDVKIDVPIARSDVRIAVPIARSDAKTGGARRSAGRTSRPGQQAKCGPRRAGNGLLVDTGPGAGAAFTVLAPWAFTARRVGLHIGGDPKQLPRR
jgi:hypothetical protein